MTAPNSADVEKLAAAFVAQCKAQYSQDELDCIRARNRRHNKAGRRDVCATHEFTDANMLMLDAFEETQGRGPAFIKSDSSEAEHNADAALWSAAWDKAKADFLTDDDL